METLLASHLLAVLNTSQDALAFTAIQAELPPILVEIQNDSRRKSFQVSVKLTANQAGMLRRIQWISLRFPLENDLNSIGKRRALGWDVLQKPVGFAGKTASIGAEEGLMCDGRQCALRWMNGRLLSARHPAKQVSPVTSHVVLFGLRLR